MDPSIWKNLILQERVSLQDKFNHRKEYFYEHVETH